MPLEGRKQFYDELYVMCFAQKCPSTSADVAFANQRDARDRPGKLCAGAK